MLENRKIDFDKSILQPSVAFSTLRSVITVNDGVIGKSPSKELRCFHNRITAINVVFDQLQVISHIIIYISVELAYRESK